MTRDFHRVLQRVQHEFEFQTVRRIIQGALPVGVDRPLRLTWVGGMRWSGKANGARARGDCMMYYEVDWGIEERAQPRNLFAFIEWKL